MAASTAGATFLHNAAGALWTTQAKAAAEATALTAGGVGMGLWSWNRGYYSYDSKQRWARFNFINNMAIAQTGQYREDIEDLAFLTSNKMDNYHILGVMALTIATALFCPGRLGLHTPPPPSWLMGLFMCNLAGAYLWLGLTMWMAMHASLRADSAACHMLTRMVRLPVPSIRQLDRARRIFSSWEYQNFGELFRVPFLQKHATKNSAVQREDRPPEEADMCPQDDGAKSRFRCQADVPAWFRRERMVDQGRPIEAFMPRSARGKGQNPSPEHFEVFRVIQNEYWPYDVYARVSMLLSWLHLTSAWTYHQLGHVVTELRAPWVACILILPVFVAQNAMLTLDIKSKSGNGIMAWHRFGPLGFFTALVAQLLEYQRWYSEAGIYFSALCVFLTYIFTIIYTIQLIRLTAPDENPPEAAEALGAAWWPGQWRLPKGFAYSTWLVAPPRQRAVGEVDIVDELRRSFTNRHGDVGRAVVDPNEDKKDKADDVHRAFGKQNEAPAWFYVRTGLYSILIGWIWLTIGYFVDILNEGTVHPSLINAPGLPNNLRDPRNRPPKPGYLCAGEAEGECFGQEVGLGGWYAGPMSEQIHKQIGNEAEHGGHHRRLSSQAQLHVSEKIRDLLPHLQHMVQDRDDSKYAPFGLKSTAAIDGGAATVPARADVTWPKLFEPRILACGPGSSASEHMAITLSRHGRGAFVNSMEQAVETQSFVLEGTALLGPFLAAHWDSDGLVLATAAGGFVECPGAATGSRWQCKALSVEKLPLGLGTAAFGGALAVARQGAELLSAVFFPGEHSVAIFRRGGEHQRWLPAGEARTPSQVVAASFHDNAESLLMLMADGSAVKMRLSDGAMALTAEAVRGPAHTWQGACAMSNSKVARLGVRPSGSATWEPSLIFSA